MMSRIIHDAFSAVHADETLKSSTREYISKRLKSETGPRFRPLAALACLAAVLIVFFAGKMYVTPVSSISVDVNPSLELGVNRFDRVVSAVGCNAEGEELVSNVKVFNRSYTDALTLILASDAMRPYLDDGAEVSFTVAGDSRQKSEEMSSRITESCCTGIPGAKCGCADAAEQKAAREAGLPYGKYRAFLELQALDPDATPDDVRGMSMRQIRDRIDELSGNPSSQGQGMHRYGKDKK